jgi:hypothetical protein
VAAVVAVTGAVAVSGEPVAMTGSEITFGGGATAGTSCAVVTSAAGTAGFLIMM